VNLIFEIVDFDFSYDSVDKAILANPHTFNKISYSVEKCLSSAVSTIDTYTPTSSASGKFPNYQAAPYIPTSSASGKFSIYQVELSLKFL